MLIRDGREGRKKGEGDGTVEMHRAESDNHYL